MELPPAAFLAPYLHQGPPGGPAELCEGGLRHLQGRGQGAGLTPCLPLRCTSPSSGPRSRGRRFTNPPSTILSPAATVTCRKDERGWALLQGKGRCGTFDGFPFTN